MLRFLAILFTFLCAAILTPMDAKNVSSTQNSKAPDGVASVSLEINGGFAAVHEIITLSSNSISKGKGEQLSALIDKTGILKSADTKKDNPSACDARVYDIAVTSNHRAHKARFDDASMPSSYRELVDFVKKYGVTRDQRSAK